MSTIKDVARKANVSVTTVSRVLNNNGYVHIDTKKIIIDAINELNYTPNALAVGLSRGVSNSIGLIIENITSTTSSKLIEKLELLCQENGYRLFLGITRKSIALEKYYYSIFKKYDVNGIIFANIPNNIDDFLSLNKPITTLDCYINENYSSIKTNYNTGCKEAVKQLIENNCNNILIIKYEDDEIKANSFINELNENNISYTIKTVKNNFNKEEINEILTDKYDAIYATCDLLALSTLSTLQSKKIKIPDVCSIIGTDNSSFASILNPSLTSVDYPAQQLAESTFNILHNNITTENVITKHIIIDSSLIKRESTNKENNY